jgi:hypothetical protein
MTSVSNNFLPEDTNDGIINDEITNDEITNYDNSLEDNLDPIEGYSDMNPNNLTRQTKEIINTNDYSNQELIIDNLRKEYDKTLQEYKNLINQISKNADGYVDRVSSKNPYLNKSIAFTTGHVCYVTKQGVVKYITSPGAWNTVKAPKNVIRVNIPWLNSYFTPGTIIPTNPPLISGTPIQRNQSLGNEGSNVFVDQLLPPLPEATYMGCFAVNKNNDNMEFIGNKPPVLNEVSIQNGNFRSPVIPDDSFRYLRGGTVPGWNLNNGVLLNNSRAWGYRMPYPGGNQAVSIQNTSSIDTTLPLQSDVTYVLKLQACGRNCCQGTTTSNPINIELYTNLNALVSNIATFTAPINSWTSYSYTFTVPTSQTYKLVFKGTNTSGDRATALTNINLQSDIIPKGRYNYETCRQAATTNGYRYFGLQNVNTSSRLGYCAVSNSTPAIMKDGTSRVVSRVIQLWSSRTAGNPGNTAILTNTGSLQVLNSSGTAVYSSPRSTKSGINCFLALESNGNMAIYEGTNPQNRTTEIWSTMTTGRQQEANSEVVASKGKYGQNFMTVGSTLAPGDFIGSNDGRLALVMQTDGNLVLNTYQTDINCPKTGNTFGGGKGANAVYDIGMNAITKNMGAVGFIDGNSTLYTYPMNNQKYSDVYSKIENIDTPLNDILPTALTVSSAESCKAECNKNPNCAGFVTNAKGTLCWPKNNKMYPFGGQGNINSDRNIYVRTKQPLTPPLGVSTNTISMNSVDYENYIKRQTLENKYGLANANSVQKQQLNQLRSKLNMLSKQITDLTNKFQSGSVNAEQQSSKNISGVDQYFKDFNNTNNKIRGIAEDSNGGIENILNDSDIVVLQKNYDYLFWSILAVGTVLVSMNVLKKE